MGASTTGPDFLSRWEAKQSDNGRPFQIMDTHLLMSERNAGRVFALIFFIAAGAIAAAPASAKSAIVVSSIRRVNSLVAAFMQGVGQPSTLIPSDEAPAF